MRKRLKILLPIVILLAGLATAFLLIKNRKMIQATPVAILPPLVRVVLAQPTNIQFKVRSQGTVAPRSEITLAPEVSGRVVSISPSMAAGGFFEKGEVLLTIEQRDFELAVIRTNAQVSEATARVAREEAEAEVARKEWKALGSGAPPSPLALRQPQLDEARAALASAQAALEQAERDVEKSKVRAPFAGRVWEKRVDVGQFVNRGTTVARLYAVDFAEVRLPVPASELAFIELPIHYRGDPALRESPRVVVRGQYAGKSHAWEGQIIRTEGEIDPRSRMVTLVASLPDPYGRALETDRPPLSVGMFVEAEIFGQSLSNVFSLPRASLREGDKLLLVDDESALHFRQIRLIRTDRESVIFDSGIQSGDRVCISPLDTPVEGMKVRVGLDSTADQPPDSRGGQP
ncbi:MAG: efflux RND transporter periplasmic adaptor subunit [Verrucomicrobia bacterium]|nr:efflux RND transporter periplasmic adaptor subunit [Verrucomicrobiota bacterium]